MESLLIVYSRTWYFRKYTGARQVGFAFLNSLTSLLLCCAHFAYVGRISCSLWQGFAWDSGPTTWIWVLGVHHHETVPSGVVWKCHWKWELLCPIQLIVSENDMCYSILGTNVRTKIALKLKMIYSPFMAKKQTTTLLWQANTNACVAVQDTFWFDYTFFPHLFILFSFDRFCNICNFVLCWQHAHSPPPFLIMFLAWVCCNLTLDSALCYKVLWLFLPLPMTLSVTMSFLSSVCITV